jgi:uncharacterized protein
MIRSASRLAATSVALMILAGSALAQTAQPTPSQIALGREVAVGSGMTRSFDAISEPMLDQLQQMDVTRPEIKKDLAEVIGILRPEIDKHKQQMVEATARIFATQLTEAELRDVAAFFKSPSGMKYVQAQPVILDDMVREIATWTQNLSEYILVRARAEMAKRGHQLQ